MLFAEGQTTETLYLNKYYKPVSESKAVYKKITSLQDGITEGNIERPTITMGKSRLQKHPASSLRAWFY